MLCIQTVYVLKCSKYPNYCYLNYAPVISVWNHLWNSCCCIFGHNVNTVMMRQLPWWPLYPKCAQVQMPSIMQHILHLDGSPSCHISTHKFMQKQGRQIWLQIPAAFQREFLRITFQLLSLLPCLKIAPNSYNFPCFHAFKEKFQHAVFMGMIWPIWKLPWWPSLEATWTLSNSGKWCQDSRQYKSAIPQSAAQPI